MQRDAAGMATELPIISLVTAQLVSDAQKERKNGGTRTDVTPDWRLVDDVRIPDHRINEEDQACQSRPYHVHASTRVPCWMAR